MILINRFVTGLLIIVTVAIDYTVASEERNEYYAKAIDRKSCVTRTGYSGTCMTKFVCNQNGGKESGNCQGLGICCDISLQCSDSTNHKRTLIETPKIGAAQCSYTFTPYSKNVCQIKIEMKKLRLQQPTITQIDAMHCSERFEVNGMTFCGNNDNQHLYVPFDVSGGTANVNLVFNLDNPNTGPQWELNVTQLECSGNGDDQKTLAPIGCTQYFTERSGTFRSINYNSGSGPYMANLNYAICFQRQIHDSVIEFAFTEFGLPNQGANNGYDTDCHPLIVTMGKAQDHLMIPGGVISTYLQPTYFCGTLKEGLIVTSSGTGPFMIYFNSDENWSPEDKGFEITYNIR